MILRPGTDRGPQRTFRYYYQCLEGPKMFLRPQLVVNSHLDSNSAIFSFTPIRLLISKTNIYCYTKLISAATKLTNSVVTPGET